MTYEFNNQNITSLNKLVLAVVKFYINQHPESTYNELKQIFQDKIAGNNRGVLKNESDYQSFLLTNKSKKRFYEDDNDVITLKDGDKIYVCNQWGDDYTDKKEIKHQGNKQKFLDFAKNELGYQIIEKLNQTKNQQTSNNISNETEEHKEIHMMNIKNIILYGAPGIGKTHNINKLINLIESNIDLKSIFSTVTDNQTSNDELTPELQQRVKFLTFHQSFSYEDFIEGFRPNENGEIKLQDGIFKIFCDNAIKNHDKRYYLIIDEINRGNISKIFGELITLIEESKRGEKWSIELPYSKKPFFVPENLYIIATMNSTDKSIATIDIALRRRFTFLKLTPNNSLVPKFAQDIFNQLNDFIKTNRGEDYQIGHSYFMNIAESDFEFIKTYKIKPLLEEYFYGDDENFKQAVEKLNNSDTNNSVQQNEIE